MKVLGVITARGGSKGLPGKNIAPLGGKPLIAWTIEAAQQSRLLTKFIISTDDDCIASVCRAAGAEVPFLRPPELARDDTPTLPVVLHVLDFLAESFDAVMVLQPTSPLRTHQDIDSAINLLEKNLQADSVISVVAVGDHHPARMKLLENGILIDPPFAEEVEGRRRQDLVPLYLRNGAIYLTRINVLREQESFKGRKCMAYIMPEERSVNVDRPLDLVIAEALLARLSSGAAS